MSVTLAELVKQHHIAASAKYGAPKNEEFQQADGWTVTLRMGRRRLTVPFYKGYGHGGKEPTAIEVLECLLSDAFCAYTNSFEDFCADLGYDPDSRKAERTFKQCLRIAAQLGQFLGEQFETFLNAERE